jgi:hypothetical protein
MDATYLGELYLSVRPYLSEAGTVQTFLDSHATLQPEELTLAIQDAIETYQGTKKTDFSILLNAHEKLMSERGGSD